MPKPELYKDSFVVHNLLEFNFWSHVPRINFSTDENKYHWLRQHCIKEKNSLTFRIWHWSAQSYRKNFDNHAKNHRNGWPVSMDIK